MVIEERKLRRGIDRYFIDPALIVKDTAGKSIALVKKRTIIIETGEKGKFITIPTDGTKDDIIKKVEEHLIKNFVQRLAYAGSKQAETSAPKETNPMTMSIDANRLTIVIDLNQAGMKSASGKSTVIESTRGNITVPGTDLKLGLNLYRPIKGE